MSARGLPGSLVEAIRAGIRTMMDIWMKEPERAVSKVAKRLMETALIGVATTKQKT
jgi:hypothetical protein